MLFAVEQFEVVSWLSKISKGSKFINSSGKLREGSLEARQADELCNVFLESFAMLAMKGIE